jgi:hypothetical protein
MTGLLKKIGLIKIVYFLLSFGFLVFITYQGSLLRQIGYERIPENKIFDERNYALQGISIRKSGIPIGWSDSGAYDNGFKPEDTQAGLPDFNITAWGNSPTIKNFNMFPKPLYIVREYNLGYGVQQVKLVQPFLDHSPIGGLITSAKIPKNISDFSDIKPEDYRKPMLTIGVIVSVLLAIYTYLVTGSIITSLITTALYNTVPTYLLISRFALLENILIPFILIQLIFLHFAKEDKKYSLVFLVLSGIFSGLGILIKEASLGIMISSLVVLIYIAKHKVQKILIFLSCSAIPVIIYILWGLWMSPKLFLEVFLFNTSRGFFGSLNFLSIIPSLRFANFPLDGWWVWGLISVIYLAFRKPKQYSELLIPFGGYLLFLLFLSNANYPWYYFPLIPFICITSAISILDIAKRPVVGLIVPFALIPLSSSLYWGYSVFNLPPQIQIYRVIIFGFILIGILKSTKPKNNILNLFWLFICFGVMAAIIKWNRSSIFYIITNWNNLPQITLF